jgi:hypothetical protein
LVFKFLRIVYENVLFERKKIKLWNKQHFVENKTNYAVCLKNAVNFLVAYIYIKWVYRGFVCVCVCAHMHTHMWMLMDFVFSNFPVPP